MVHLYVISGFQRSNEAEQILQRNRVPYQVFDVEETGLLAEIDRTLSITKLPAIIDAGKLYEGIICIREHYPAH